MKIAIGWTNSGSILGPQIIKFIQENFEEDEIQVMVQSHNNGITKSATTKAGELLSKKKVDRAIVISETSITAFNSIVKMPNVIVGQVYNTNFAQSSREHNNVNAIAIGQFLLTLDEAQKIVRIFLTEKFSKEERHMRRVKLLKGIK